MRHSIIATLFSMSLVIATNAFGQSISAQSWEGLWVADGSNFSLRLRQDGTNLHVEPVDSQGFFWKNSVGVIRGDNASIIVQYQGATASIIVSKSDIGTAVARPTSCSPDYHFICALVQNQQASFTRVVTSQSRASSQ